MGQTQQVDQDHGRNAINQHSQWSVQENGRRHQEQAWPRQGQIILDLIFWNVMWENIKCMMKISLEYKK